MFYGGGAESVAGFACSLAKYAGAVRMACMAVTRPSRVPDPAPGAGDVTFARDLGLFDATMIGVGAMIGVVALQRMIVRLFRGRPNRLDEFGGADTAVASQGQRGEQR